MKNLQIGPDVLRQYYLHSATGIFRLGLVLTMTRMMNNAKGKTISATNRNWKGGTRTVLIT